MYSKGDICNPINENAVTRLGFFLTMEFHFC